MAADNKPKKQPAKLQRRLFRYIMAPAVLIILLTLVFFTVYLSRLLIQREITAMETLNASIMTQVDTNIRELDILSSNINYFNRKTGFIPEYLDSASVRYSKENGQDISEYLVTLNGLEMKADQMNLYDFHGNILETGIITKCTDYPSEETPWISEVKQLSGNKMIGTPYLTKKYSPAAQSSDWFISLYRAAVNAQNRTVGIIETLRRCRSIFRPITSYTSSTSSPASVYIFDADGNLIYPYETGSDEEKQYLRYYEMLSTDADKTESGHFLNPVNQAQSQYVVHSSAYSGWTYMTIQRDSVILSPVIRLFYVVIGILLLLTAISSLLSWRLARSLATPIHHLRHVIQRLRLETIGQENVSDYTKTSFEELNDLYREYQKMNDSLQSSLRELEVSRQLEFRSREIALQAQMNPHFYFNTLSCISVLAEDGRDQDVTGLCQALSQIMRYITDSSSAIVPLATELDYVQKYLYCMQTRYQDSLTFSLDIPEELLGFEIPKLIIQPLVENAIKYGTDCIPPWHIDIRAHSDSADPEKLENWEITISDRGTGFKSEVLNEVERKIRDIDLHPENMTDAMKIGGMGMVNVYIRWKLYAKEKAVFTFGNTDEGHAFVTIGYGKPEGEK